MKWESGERIRIEKIRDEGVVTNVITPLAE
jgi:hypothetical protein